MINEVRSENLFVYIIIDNSLITVSSAGELFKNFYISIEISKMESLRL